MAKYKYLWTVITGNDKGMDIWLPYRRGKDLQKEGKVELAGKFLPISKTIQAVTKIN